jgi:hypothetical protein
VIKSTHSNRVNQAKKCTKRFCLPRLAKSDSIQNLWGTATGDSKKIVDVITYIAGYLTLKWLDYSECTSCNDIMYANMSESTFLNLKDFTPNALRRPNKDLVATLLKAEDIFLAAGPSLLRTDNILLLLMNRSSHLAMPTCHLHPSMCQFFLKKYFLIRVHHSCKLLTYSLKDDQRTRQKKYKRLNALAKTCLGRACRHSIRKCI